MCYVSPASTLPPLLPRQHATLPGNHGRKSKLIEEINPSSRSTGQTGNGKTKQRKSRHASNDEEEREREKEGEDGRKERVIVKPEHVLMVKRERERPVVCVKIKLPDVSSVEQMNLDSSEVCWLISVSSQQ